MDNTALDQLCAMVDGEKIDLNDYDRRIRLVKRSLSRCNSNQTLPESKRDHGHATSWKKLANNLYKPIPSYSIYKTYPRDRVKQTRAASADPRFRQERKSSTNLVGNSDMNVIKPVTSINPSISRLNNINQTKHDNMGEVDLSKRVISKNRIPIRKSNTFIDEMERHRLSKEPPAAYQSSLHNKDNVTDTSCYGSAHSVQDHNLASIVGLSENTDTAIEFESLQENFISSLQQDKDEITILSPDRNLTSRYQNDWQTTTVNTDDDLKTINPDWSTIEVFKSENVNPQLIRHCPVIKTKHLLKKSTSSWTMPVVKHKLPPGICVCQKCDCTTKGQRGSRSRTMTYLYDNHTDVTTRKSKIMRMGREVGMARKLSRQILRILANYHIFMCFILGSLIGLALVASVIWLLSNDQLWTIVNKKEIRRTNPVRAAIMSITNVLNNVVNSVLGAVYQTIMLPRNAVYSTKDDGSALSEFLMSFISS